MAETISAVIQIAVASCKAVEKTIQFIREVCVVEKSVKRLVETLHRLQETITLVTETCEGAGGNATNRALTFIRATLATCNQLQEEVVNLTKKLAVHGSDTLLQKFTLKVRSDWSRPDIETIIGDIKLLMDMFNTGISCWALYEQGSSLRVHEEMQRITQDERVDTILSPSISNDTTICETVARCPTGISASITPPAANPAQENIELQTETCVGCNHVDEPTRFHYEVAKCMCREEQIVRIRDTLREHPESSTLSRSVDDTGRTPLHLAAENDDVGLARVLVNHSADIDAEDCEHASVLDFAVANNHENSVNYLFDEGVDQEKVSAKNQPRFEELKQMIELRKTHDSK
ncbi:hypothetical protein P153DRAFT_322020 [Dothidotthia symphoricarpi CBS 119687]|uniref:Uncharacterized protein n=1 Tax=Dothidotthia symphoricarpi CBS 119687 TaxID=1392245 RepID=A0A6A6A437_9PLEO|nr:uncharacterized protein P153DRAFT_322020 [Dothidotthia symphoricarpi CBS 119687]KAF2126316.1 hypothetical protein P153DRAFT_322020 [Dothidotthia symphoricarpi CBS 119687]